jgi:curved DNA-binding protein
MSDLFGGRGGRRRAKTKGANIASEVTVDFGAAISGTEVQVRLQDHAEPVKVRIPAGAGDGDKVRVPGHGAPGAPGGGPGDLIIAVRVRPHEYFERSGLDLYLDLPIGVAEAYRGGKVTVPTPEGNVTMKVPKLAQSGQVVRLKGRGVKRKNAQGDLYVRFLIRLPSAESAELDEAVEAFEQAADENLRAGISF